MAKKGFCVGINDYIGVANDLKGCVRDAQSWASVLADHYDFAKSDVRLMTDTEATKANILDGLKALLASAQAKDVLVFTNSSHGTYLTDLSGDEPDFDEAICPYDLFDNLLIDDDLRELFQNLPTGVRLTVISDSCFSGTVTRALLNEILPGIIPPRDRRRVRFLHPVLLGKVALINPWAARRKAKMAYSQASMSHVLISGCTNLQYSYDAFIDGAYHGTMSYAALQALQAANYQLTYRQLLTSMRSLLNQWGYQGLQTPQLEGPSGWKRRQVFV